LKVWEQIIWLGGKFSRLEGNFCPRGLTTAIILALISVCGFGAEMQLAATFKHSGIGKNDRSMG
jgi:hypothetical protein